MSRAANPLLLGFRHTDVLEKLVERYKVIYGPAALNTKACIEDERFMQGYNTETFKGMCFADKEFVWLASGLEEEHDVTLVHELLHAYCWQWEIDDLVEHDLIEYEAQILVEDEPGLVGFITSYFNCDKRKYR